MPLEYSASNGCTFYCPVRDLSKPVLVTYPQGRPGGLPLDLDYILREVSGDVAEFMGWYMLNVYPPPEFQGYDSIRFEFQQH
jgi:hypothetical protein